VALFTQDTIERVKDSADIVEVISAYTDLRRSGQRMTGLCPFHDERTPSFSVDPGAKLYHCFGCGVGGDVIKFVEEKEGLAFADAVEALADRYGVEVEREQSDPRVEEQRRRRARLAELMDRTAQFYAAYLWDSDEARRAREYLTGRGLTEQVLRDFGVGFAPNKWDTVVLRGQRAGFTRDELVAAGLVKKGNRGGWLDHFRARIMFPIRDARGRMQGFGGRATREEQRAKYVNSPEGELYRKSRTLYGIERARPAIAKRGRAVVVEGYTDVIAAHQAGVEETVAVMGTAITPEQVKLLAAHTEEVVLALDADRAGREAMLRAQRVATGKRVRLRVAAMPEGEDPADLLSGAAAGSAEAERFAALVDAAADLPAFHVRTLLGEADLRSPAGRDRALDEVVAVLAGMGDSITRDELVREVGDALSADPSLVSRRLVAAERGRGREAATPRPSPVTGGGSSGGQDAGAPAKAPAPAALSAHELRERALLAMCIAAPAHGRDALERLDDELISSPAMLRARDWLREHLEDPQAGLPREDEELVNVVTELVMRSQREPAGPEAIELNLLHLQRSALDRQIAAAEANGGDPPVELQKARAELTERLAHQQSPPPKRR
jgi:DNA primase